MNTPQPLPDHPPHQPGAGADAVPGAGAGSIIVIRPHRIVIWGSVSAAVIFGVSLVVGILLRNSADGVAFQTSDQIGVIGVGLVLAACILIAAARPRLEISERGLRIRNMVGHQDLAWPLVHRISFPEGAQWPLLQLADDETYPVVAIQAMDRERALASLKVLRAAFDRWAPPRPVPSPQALAARAEAARLHEAQRPLGRLEVQDLARARKQEAAKPAAARRPRSPGRRSR